MTFSNLLTLLKTSLFLKQQITQKLKEIIFMDNVLSLKIQEKYFGTLSANHTINSF